MTELSEDLSFNFRWDFEELEGARAGDEVQRTHVGEFPAIEAEVTTLGQGGAGRLNTNGTDKAESGDTHDAVFAGVAGRRQIDPVALLDESEEFFLLSSPGFAGVQQKGATVLGLPLTDFNGLLASKDGVDPGALNRKGFHDE